MDPIASGRSGFYFPFFISFLFFLFIFSAGALSTFAQSSRQVPELQYWGAHLDAQTLREKALNQNLHEVLFKAVDEVHLFQVSPGEASIDLKVKRQVMDNEDGTWSVIDRFNLKGQVPLFEQALGSFAQAGSLAFHIGTQQGMEFLNIRQVTPQSYSALPGTQERRREIESTRLYAGLSSQTSEEGEDPEGEWSFTGAGSGEKRFSFLPRDPKGQVQFSRFWNLALFPFRLPLNTRLLGKLENGEIISYAAQGMLELGPTVGWNLDPSGVTQLVKGELSFTAFLRGTYRITVLKENPCFARVKVTRIKEKGLKTHVGGSAKSSPLEGLLAIRTRALGLKLAPFNATLSKAEMDTFDVAYRYDLQNENAREAYDLAVRGRFGLSEQLAMTPEGQPKDHTLSGVQRILTRENKAEETHLRRSMRLSFFFKAASDLRHSDIVSVITQPDGIKNLAISLSETSSEWKTFWGAYEKLRFRFGVHVDLDHYERDPHSPEASFLVVEGEIRDSSTSYQEMMNYILGVEDAIARFGVFPRPPVPLKNSFGPSRFLFQITLDQLLLDELIHYDEEKSWMALESAFNVGKGSWSSSFARSLYGIFRAPLSLINIPLYIADLNIREGSNLWHARRIRARWLKIRRQSDPLKRASALAKMFFDPLYSYELVRLLRYVFNQKPAKYLALGYNRVFGRTQNEGSTELSFAHLATKQQRGSASGGGAAGAGISELALTRQGKTSQLSFQVAAPPYAIYVKISQESGFLFFSEERTVADLLAFNYGQFHAGKNIIHLDPEDANSPWQEIAKHLALGKKSKLALSVNATPLNWGEPAVISVNPQ